MPSRALIQQKPDTSAALDGDAHGIKRRLKRMFKKLNELDYWRVLWWNNRTIRINGEDRSALINSPEISN